MPTKKLWNHVIEVKEEFVLRKKKMYSLSREKREEIYKFIKEQLRKNILDAQSCLKWHQCFL